jgi:hypothetical protein
MPSVIMTSEDSSNEDESPGAEYPKRLKPGHTKDYKSTQLFSA